MVEPLNFDKFIDEPEYFMDLLLNKHKSSPRKLHIVQHQPKITDVMVKAKSKHNNSARSHLIENLDDFSKEAILENVRNIRDNLRTDFMKTINGEKLHDAAHHHKSHKHHHHRHSEHQHQHNDHPNCSSDPNIHHQIMRKSTQSSLPSGLQHLGVISVDSEDLSSASSPNLGRESSRSQPPAALIISMDSEQSLHSLLLHNQGQSPAPLDGNVNTGEAGHDNDMHSIASEGSLGSLGSVTQSEASASTKSALSHLQRKLKISEIKPVSNALLMYEEYKTQQAKIAGKSFAEGRKKANNLSKFRLHDIDKERESLSISMVDIVQQKLKLELSIFQSMYPNSSYKQREEFVKAFKEKYPEAVATPGIVWNNEQTISLNYASVLSTLPDVDKSTFLHTKHHEKRLENTLNHKNDTSSSQVGKEKSLFSLADSFEAKLKQLHEEDEKDEQLHAWQDFTIESIVKEKNGERKTLPAISLGKTVAKMGLHGKKYRSDRAQRGGNGVLITLPAKASEIQMTRPPTYLELYKTSFNIFTQTEAKTRLMQEFKEKAGKL